MTRVLLVDDDEMSWDMLANVATWWQLLESSFVR